VGARNLVEHASPVPHRRTGRAVDDRVALVEHEVTHVNHVRTLEGDHCVATRVCAPVVSRDDSLVADVGRPDVGEGRVRIEGLGGGLLLLRRLRLLVLLLLLRLHLRHRRASQVEISHAVRDDAPGDATEHGVSGRVVGVMVRVEQHVDAAVARPRLQPVEQSARLGGKLRVDDGYAAGIHQPSHRSATHCERADVAADRREYGLRLRRLPSERGEGPGDGDAQCRSGGAGNEIAAAGGHRRSDARGWVRGPLAT
jgi:hypothetical protein